jgi:restriction endonuclease
MKIQFDAQQQYELDAVAAVVDFFDGQMLQHRTVSRSCTSCPQTAAISYSQIRHTWS